VCEGAALAGKRRVDLIKASIEVSDETGCFSVTVCAEDIQQAVELAMDRYPGRAVKVKFPLDPETFFVRDTVIGADRAQLVTSERGTDKPGRDGDAPGLGGASTTELSGRYDRRRRASNPVKAMVLAAGKGTRLFPLTGEIPKPMAPVVDKPVIQHIFELLAGAGVDEVHVNVCYLADAILDFYGEETQVDGMSINFSRERELMGTAGGVKRLADRFDETFVVIMGDALTDVDVRELVDFHKNQGSLATIALMRVADTSQYGTVELDSENNIVTFQEKPTLEEAMSNLANTGIYVLEPEVLEYVPENTFFDFAKDLFPRLLEAGEKFTGYEGDFYWSDIGTLEAYRAAQHDVLTGKVRVRIPGARKGGSLWACRSAQLHPTATVEGGVFVGEDVVIGRGVAIAGDTTVGSGCWIRPTATVKRSVLLPGACVGERAYLEDCIVGPGYYVRPGVLICGGVLVRGAG
jgi:mannose-1-phosphate guanylyltransferase